MENNNPKKAMPTCIIRHNNKYRCTVCDCIVSQGRAEDHADADLHVNKLAKKGIYSLLFI